MSLNIAIITWWNNNEREISLKSAHAVKQWLESLWYDTVWRYDFPNDTTRFTLDHTNQNIDFVFLMIHWSWWEDWQIASFLDLLWINYHCTTPDILALTMNKWHTKLVRRAHGIPVADDTIILPNKTTFDEITKTIESRFWFPCVRKELDQWSSNGVSIIRSKDDCKHIYESYKTFDKPILIEQFIVWKEITIPLLDQTNWTQVLPLIHIIPPEEWWFDYENKYNGKTQEICPTDFEEWIIELCNTLSLRAYKSVWCTKYARIDAILTNQWPIFLEINTIPWFTDASLFPKSAQVAWYTFPQILAHLISLSHH